MPNQYTKFHAASDDPTTRAFTWREYTGKKQKRGRGAKKKDPRLPFGEYQSPIDASSTSSQTTSTDSTLSFPCSPLLQYLPSGGLRIDPFHAYPVTPNRDELAVLDHYLYILVPSGKQNELVLKPRTPRVDPHINLLLPIVMQDHTLFDAMLASCQASISLSTGLSAYKDSFFMLHRGRAMAGLRQKLSNHPDTSSILIVTLLITCDYLLGDTQAVADHTRALQRMIKLVGDLPDETAWDRFVKTGAEAYKYIGSMATGISAEARASPLDLSVDPFKDLEYPEQPFPPFMYQQWVSLPSAFSNLIVSSKISTQLCDIITAIDQVVTQPDPTSVANLRHMNPIYAALQRFAQHKQATYLERCLASGLANYTFQYPRLQIPNMFHDPPMQGMLRLFSVPYRAQSDLEQETLIWAAVVSQGFMSLRASPLPKCKEIFMDFFARQPSLKDWPSVESIVKRYFWNPVLMKRWKTRYEALLLEIDRKGARTATLSPTDTDSEPVLDDVPEPAAACPVSGQLTGPPGTLSGMCPFFPTSSPSTP